MESLFTGPVTSSAKKLNSTPFTFPFTKFNNPQKFGQKNRGLLRLQWEE